MKIGTICFVKHKPTNLFGFCKYLGRDEVGLRQWSNICFASSITHFVCPPAGSMIENVIPAFTGHLFLIKSNAVPGESYENMYQLYTNNNNHKVNLPKEPTIRFLNRATA